MADNATDEVNYYEIEEGDDSQQTKYITWPENADDNQGSILQPVSGNGGRKLKRRVETRHGAKERTNLAALKLIARKGGDEKSQLEEWKTDLLNHLTAEISQIHKMHGRSKEGQREEMENQREQFQFEIEILREKIRDLEIENEKSVQGRAQQESRSTPRFGTPEREPISSQTPREKVTKQNQIPPVKPKEQRSYATVAAAKPAQTQTQPRAKVSFKKSSEQPWTKVSYGTRKSNMRQPNSTIQQEQLGRRVLFPGNAGQEKSEADLMLALNEALQQAGEEMSLRFIQVRYAPSGAISALLFEKADAGQLLPRRSNLLIRAVKALDPAVVGIEIPEHWQRLKVHGMPLKRYLGEGKMELLKREVESVTGIQLKLAPRWLINESRLREQQESSNKRGSAIVITVGNKAEAKRLCVSGLRFGGIVKRVEKYWEVGPSSVCRTCCGIGHERMGQCGDRLPKCVICAGSHKVEDHQCGVVSCHKKPGKICLT